MDMNLLQQHIEKYKKFINDNADTYAQDVQERQERMRFYREWTADRIRGMNDEEFAEYLSKLWAMLIWGNKKYIAEKIIQDNGFSTLKEALANLVWGQASIEDRWDGFRSQIKGIGPAMMSELLCHVHPNECMVWNRRAYVGLNYLRVENLPRYDYQLTGQRYAKLSAIAKELAAELANQGIKESNLLAVDYFIWHELQVEDNLSQIHRKAQFEELPSKLDEGDAKTSEFIHNDVRDKLAEIGRWLGFDSRVEVGVAAGSQVDTIWEATIGNMGRVIYVFEVQTKGSIDSLMLNLLKSLNNPAVQGIVAVSDTSQIEKIKKHAAGVAGLKEKLKYWDYKEVLRVYEALELVNESINSLSLVPQGF